MNKINTHTVQMRSLRCAGIALIIILAPSASLPHTLPVLAPTPAFAGDKKSDAEALKQRLALPMAPVTAEQPAGKIALPEGTRIKLVLLDELKSNKSQTGEEVHYALRENLCGPNGEILIPKGTSATGKVTRAKGAGGLGRKGKLEFSVDAIETATQEKVPLRSAQAADGKSRGNAVVALGLLVSPLAVFMKGKNVTVSPGEVVEAFVDNTTVLPQTAFDNMTRHDVDALVKLNSEAKK